MISPLLFAAFIAAAPVQAPTGTLLIIGDSLTNAGEAVQRVARRLPWLQTVGPKTSAWGAKHCGYNGYSAKTYVDDVDVPFRPAGTFDMEPSLTAWGCPDIAVIALGINYLIDSADAADLLVRVSEELADIDTMIVELRSVCGADTKVIITSPGESNADLSVWAGSPWTPPKNDRSRWEGFRATAVASWAAQYAGRTGEGIYYLAYVLQGTGDYLGGDQIHPDPLGYERMVSQLAVKICEVVGGCP